MRMSSILTASCSTTMSPALCDARSMALVMTCPPGARNKSSSCSTCSRKCMSLCLMATASWFSSWLIWFFDKFISGIWASKINQFSQRPALKICNLNPATCKYLFFLLYIFELRRNGKCHFIQLNYMEIDWLSITGISASVFTGVSLLPQLIKIFREKKAGNVSGLMLLVMFVGLVLWILYGIQKNDYIIVVSNAFALCVNIVTSVLTLKYKDMGKWPRIVISTHERSLPGQCVT